MQGSPTGRLLRYDPATRETVVLAGGIWFANGIALSRDGNYVAVSTSLSGNACLTVSAELGASTSVTVELVKQKKGLPSLVVSWNTSLHLVHPSGCSR